MEIEIKNCNNITAAKLKIGINTLNIKYGINGTGKSTIAKAIGAHLASREGDSEPLKELTPFKFSGTADNVPEVSGLDVIRSLKVFNEDYINEYAFQQDELVKGSFDIFIRDADYERGVADIDIYMKDIKDMLAAEKDIESLLMDFNELNSSFGKATKSGIHASSAISKALKNGNKVVHISPELSEYRAYITHSENYKWVKWQIDGKSFLDISESCPYCISDIKEKRSTIAKLTAEYDAKSVENLNKVVQVFQRLDKYFSEETKATIHSFITNATGYSDDQANFLVAVRNQIDGLQTKFSNVKSIGFVSLKDVTKVIESLESHKIDLRLFNHLNSTETEKKAKIVNDSLASILEKANELQGKINVQRKLIERLVRENNDEINSFLKNAGYNYSVQLVPQDNGEYRLKLVHNDMPTEIKNVKSRLSFGERNAFALVLFMYDALKANPDLIVLDDPISSFDKNKKFAIIDMLFRRNGSFRDKTVLLLTHDFEPIVDMVYHHRDLFPLPSAFFLENIHGQLTEREIAKSNISTYFQVCSQNIASSSNMINKLVYLRRKLEIADDKNIAFQLLSCIFHKRNPPTFRSNDPERNMTDLEIEEAEKKIREFIPDFNHNSIMQLVQNDQEMRRVYETSPNNYEKLHVYRIIFDDKPSSPGKIIEKFINESFHIENDYIYQLNPRDYQLVPQYVVSECDSRIQTL